MAKRKYTGKNITLNQKEVQYSYPILNCLKNKKTSIDLNELEQNHETFLPEKVSDSFPFKSYKASIFLDQNTGNPIYFIDYISFNSPRKILGRFSGHKDIDHTLDEIYDQEKNIMMKTPSLLKLYISV